jgi:hypothetical protein
VLKFTSPVADSRYVNQEVSSGQICLYLWRSLEAPGVSYLPSSVESAHNVYCQMLAEGYIVKAVELGSGREFEIRNGTLMPVRCLRTPSSNVTAII